MGVDCERTVYQDTTNLVVFIALAEEHDVFTTIFPSQRVVDHPGYVIIEHEAPAVGYKLMSILSKGMGIDNANEATVAALECLCPDMVICVGIAGSLSSDLKVGDVALSGQIIDVSQNMKVSEQPLARKRRPTKRKGARPATSQTIIQLSPKFYEVFHEISASFRFVRSHPELKGQLSGWVDRSTERRKSLLAAMSRAGLEGELEADPTTEIGPIISGPVVASSAFRDVLRRLDRKVLAIETESAGVFRACAAANVPAVTIRGISDHADLSKNVLERTTKLEARRLAMENAVDYLKIQLNNPTFMRIAQQHSEGRSDLQLFPEDVNSPDGILRKVAKHIDEYLERMSPEYRHRPKNTNLPIPRVSIDYVDDEIDDLKRRSPKGVYEAVQQDRRLYLQIPKSFPNQTLAWSIGQALLSHELDGKQILPLVISGEEIIPPSKGVLHATGVDPSSKKVEEVFCPVIIVSEPHFHSSPKTSFLIEELSRYSHVPIIVVSRAEMPVEEIERVKADLFLVGHSTSPVPFYEIANYLEAAFEMKPDEADSVASRLDDTFSKFRLHTHPAYFVGLQEATLEALIQANQRAELIQLAVDGLLSFVVAFDESRVKLSRTTREEFLSDLAFRLRVEGYTMSREELYDFVNAFSARKALEIEPHEFLRGYFSVGLLSESSGKVFFSVSYLEAYLLAERLKTDTAAAKKYFDPKAEYFDTFTFDLYVERGACAEVINQIVKFSDEVLGICSNEENVYTAKKVKPKVLSSVRNLLHFARQLGDAAAKMTSAISSPQIRMQKQRLLDTREAARGKVAAHDPLAATSSPDWSSLPETAQQEFQRLDQLSRASTLLATVIGSGAERLDGDVKEIVAQRVLQVFERFLHHWTENRLSVDFDAIRQEAASDDAIEEMVATLGLFEEDKEGIRSDLLTFINDQELKLLSGPAATLFNRIAQYAGVRSLKPIFSKMRPDNQMQKILRDVWYMDVEHGSGKKALKESLQHYKGSETLRLVITNHLMNRIFWLHWQRQSKDDFYDVARYALRPLGLKPSDEHSNKMLQGPGRS